MKKGQKIYTTKKKKSYIYVITNKKHSFYYVGKHVLPTAYKDPKKDNYYGSGKYVANYIKKHGLADIIKKIIIFGEFNRKEINKLEIKYIAEYKKKYKDKCKNFTKGGEGWPEHKPPNSGANPNDPIYKQHLSDALKGQIHITNGKVELHIKSIDKIPKGFWRGSIAKGKTKDKNKGNTWFNNGKEEKWCKKCPKGFKKGRLPTSKQTKDKISLASKTSHENKRLAKLNLLLNLDIDFSQERKYWYKKCLKALHKPDNIGERHKLFSFLKQYGIIKNEVYSHDNTYYKK